MAIYAKCLLDRWFKGSIDLYCINCVGCLPTVVPANSNLRGFVNDRTIMLRPEVRKKGPFKIIKIVVGSGYRETPDAVDAIQINGTLEPPI
jgi:hypothetical protein